MELKAYVTNVTPDWDKCHGNIMDAHIKTILSTYAQVS